METPAWTLEGQSIASDDVLRDCGIEIFDRESNKQLLDRLRVAESENPTIVQNQPYELVGIHGSEFRPDERTNGNVLKLGRERNYPIPPFEIVFMMATQLDVTALPYEHVVIMHEPLRTVDNRLVRLMIVRCNGKRYIQTCSPFDSDTWETENDIVFIFLARRGTTVEESPNALIDPSH